VHPWAENAATTAAEGRMAAARRSKRGRMLRVYAESGAGDHKPEPVPPESSKLAVRHGDHVGVVEAAVGEHAPAGERGLEGAGQGSGQAGLGGEEGQVGAADAPPAGAVLEDGLVQVGRGVRAVLEHRQAQADEAPGAALAVGDVIPVEVVAGLARLDL